MNQKILIFISLSFFLLLLGACETPETKEIVTTTNLFLKSLQTADLANLTRIAPWISKLEEPKLAQLTQVMKDVKEWQIADVQQQGSDVYVSVNLKSAGQQRTLLVPLKYQSAQWQVAENIKLSVHLDFVPLH